MKQSNKSFWLWRINMVSFALLSVLTLTGMVNWLFLPRGRATGEAFVITARHFLREVHAWTALLFILVVCIHLALHWKYIKTHLDKK